MKMNPEERLRRDAEKFKEMLSVPRPGISRELSPVESPVLKKKGIELSDIQYVSPHKLKPNPLNEYPLLADEEMDELVHDIEEKGILVPLIAKLDDMLLCGHNRRIAAIRATLDLVPVQRILTELSAALERDIMKSENDRRRGGRWSKEKKEAFIREHFGEEMQQDNRGLNRKAPKKFNELSQTGGTDLARQIEKKSRGRIPEGTAKRIVAKIRKERPRVPRGSLDEKDRKRGEKLNGRLATLREVIQMLEKKLAGAKAEEKSVIKELKMLKIQDS